MTTGEKRVVINFNPEDNSDVAVIKRETARLINAVEAIGNKNSQTGRWKSLAMTAYEEAAMYAVKALTAGQDSGMDS